MNKLIVTQYTDPMCVWCYGLEPSMRKLEFVLGYNIEFHNVLGLLVGDVSQIIGDDEFSDMKYAQLKNQMIEHFKDAGRRSGMPISTLHMENRVKEDVTSIPMSLAVAAMRNYGEEISNRFLRRIREASHSDDLIVQDMEVLKSLAGEFNVDENEFEELMLSKKTQDELNQDIKTCRMSGVTSFPTVTISYNGDSTTFRGYIDYDEIERIIISLSNGEVEINEIEATPENLSSFVSRFKRVAAVEIQTVFNLNDEELDDAVELLTKSGLYEKDIRGSSYFVVDKSGLMCDPITGTCSF